MKRWVAGTNVTSMVVLLVALMAMPIASPANADGGRDETAGGVAHTWTSYASAGGTEGPSITSQQTVAIDCRLTGFRVADGNTWWYRLASSPWNDQYYVSADVFYNGAAPGGSLKGTPFVDPALPICGAAPAQSQPPPRSVHLSRGPSAPRGYRYVITLQGFPANVPVDISCRDSVDPGGFLMFDVSTSQTGDGSTQSQCYSNDGPDHWVVADGLESNHVHWASVAASPTSSIESSASATPNFKSGSGASAGSTQLPADTCEQVSGTSAPSSHLSEWLISRFEAGYTDDVAVPWSYFSGNPQFVAEAKSLAVGEDIVGWRAVFPSDMYFALGHFTIKHTSPRCYSIFDTYDFSKLELPFWLQQKMKSAVPFNIHAAGQL